MCKGRKNNVSYMWGLRHRYKRAIATLHASQLSGTRCNILLRLVETN